MIPQPHIAELSAYALADMAVAPGKRLISLAQNESAAAPSPRALAAAREALGRSVLYPDPDWGELRAAIAEIHGLDPAMILCGAGSMELIGALIRAYAGPGAEVLASAHTYAFFRTAAAQAGAPYRSVPEADLTVSVDALLDAAGPETRVVAVANPGNPTGTWLPPAEIRRLRDGLPQSVLLIVDEAYGEFAGSPAHFDLPERGDTVVLRTFSKAYGLAAMRVGWGVFPQAVAAETRKLLNPNNISAASQAAAAAAMRDQAWMAASAAEIVGRREAFTHRLQGAGLSAIPSRTNFTLMPFASPEDAASADRALRAEGVLMRAMAGSGLPHALRATIGQPDEMALAATILETWSRR